MRYRSRSFGAFSGGRITGPTALYDFAVEGGTSTREESWDLTSPGPPYLKDNPLTITKMDVNPTRLSGTYFAYGVIPTQFESVPTGLTDPNALPLASPPMWDVLENAALMQVNPSVGEVDLGELLVELRHGLANIGNIRSLGDNLLKNRNYNPGSAYLAYQFGWRPLIADLKKLVHLSDNTYSRYQSLIQDKQKRVVGGSLGTANYRWPVSHLFNRYPWVVTTRYLVNERVTRWFTGEYEVMGEIPDPRSLVAKLGYVGFGNLSSTAWNLLPWSWLVDYFSTLGSFIQASASGIPFKLSEVNLMSKSDLQLRYLSNDSMWLYPTTEGSASRTTKRRAAVTLAKPKIAIHPILTNGQKLNLSALAVANSKLR